MKITDRWSRRRFVVATADVVALLTLVGGLYAGFTSARSEEEFVTFFDPRFPDSRRQALGMAGARRLIATNGDPTEAVHRLLTAPLPTILKLQGVTTESMPFCLQHLRPSAHLIQRRIDRDLFIWTFERS